MLEAAGLDPLPYYKEPDPSPVSNPEYAAEYPLICTTGRRSWEFFHSEHRNLRSMREFHRWPRVEMTQEVADRYGIKEGDWVLIENAQGSAREVCVINPKMAPDTICAEHGWWFPEQEAHSSNPFGVFDVNINQRRPLHHADVPHFQMRGLRSGISQRCSLRQCRALQLVGSKLRKMFEEVI